MTLANAIVRLRYLLHEPVAKMWSDAELGIWLNDGQRAMCVRRGIEEIWTDTLTAETSAVVTVDFQTIYKVVLADETVRHSDYNIFHNTITFDEAKTGTLEVYGSRAPVEATVGVDFELQDRFMEGPIYYAMSQANLKDENYLEAQLYLQLFTMKQRDWEASKKYAHSSMTNEWM
jgi:hypothetical protein